MGEADLNKERLELALEAAGLDLWENDLITGNVTRKATKTFEELLIRRGLFMRPHRRHACHQSTS